MASSFVLKRLSRRRVFIVLDDINDMEQLEYLVGQYYYLGSDNRLIVTTRDRQVLISKGVQEKHVREVSKLKYDESLELFSMHAFDKNHPEIGFDDLTEEAIRYAGHNPLALKVLGLSLHSKGKEIWESVLRRLEKYPDTKIQNVLKLSYDGLDHLRKKIFLDIACFLGGEDKD